MFHNDRRFLFLTQRISVVHLFLMICLLYTLFIQIFIGEKKLKISKISYSPLKYMQDLQAHNLRFDRGLVIDSNIQLDWQFSNPNRTGHVYKIEIVYPKTKENFYQVNPKTCNANVHCKIFFGSTMSADAEVFNLEKYIDGSKSKFLQRSRNFSDQLYVWWFDSNPSKFRLLSKKVDGLFNLTFHYRIDADIYSPFGNIYDILEKIEREEYKWTYRGLTSKPKNALAILPSDCNTLSLSLVHKMIAGGLEVDVFGKCVGRTFHHDYMFYKKLSQYKFYLIVDNFYFCNDYITEQFWLNGLLVGTLPIVFGPKKESYLKVAPTKSFIHVDDYPTIEELVKQLNFLADNDKAYAEYFQWKNWANNRKEMEERFQINPKDSLRGFCKLCSIIQEHHQALKNNVAISRKFIPSINQAWSRNEHEKCLPYDDEITY